MKLRIPRRKLLHDLYRAGAGMGAIAILGLAPEVAAVQPEPATSSSRSRLNTDDPIVRRLWAEARRTPEWTRYSAAMTTGVPAAHVAPAGSAIQLLTFTVRDLAPEAVEARRYASFEVLREVAFAFDALATVGEVLELVPDEANGRVRIGALRSGEAEVRSLSAEARTFLAARRAEAEAIRARTPRSDRKPSTLKMARPLGTHCDCYPDRVYCGQTQCYDGYHDPWCMAGCGLVCASMSPPASYVCFASCYGLCWVPPYCLCLSTYCGTCLVA